MTPLEELTAAYEARQTWLDRAIDRAPFAPPLTVSAIVIGLALLVEPAAQAIEWIRRVM